MRILVQVPCLTEDSLNMSHKVANIQNAPIKNIGQGKLKEEMHTPHVCNERFDRLEK